MLWFNQEINCRTNISGLYYCFTHTAWNAFGNLRKKITKILVSDLQRTWHISVLINVCVMLTTNNVTLSEKAIV